jgi:hypothetical protein
MRVVCIADRGRRTTRKAGWLRLAAVVGVSFAFVIGARPASAYSTYFCNNTWTAKGHRCPYDMTSQFFWSDRHSWRYVEGWGGRDSYSDTNCVEAWRDYNQHLLIRSCWFGNGYADSNAAGALRCSCEPFDGRYLSIADNWVEFISPYVGGTYLSGYATT